MNLVMAELRKLTTTRMMLGLVVAAIAVDVMAVVGTGDQAVAELQRPFREQQWVFSTATVMRVLVLVLGIRAVTDEYRYGTIVPALLVEPRRARAVAAKAAAVAAAGLALAIAAEAGLVATVLVRAAAADAAVDLGPDAVFLFAGAGAAGALWAVVGAGLGALARTPVAPIVGGLVWIMAAEEVVRGRLGDAAAYLPGQAGLAAAASPDDAAVAMGVLTLAAYAAAAWLAATVATARRDVV